MTSRRFCQRPARAMAIALLTNYLAAYRIPLYERLAQRYELEVLCYGGGERYVPAWFADLDAQLARAPFPARRLDGPRAALNAGRRYESVIAPFAGGAVFPAAYAGTRAGGNRFVLWASVWRQPRSAAHLLALPATRHIYRHADAVIAYGEHVRRFVASIRGRDDDVFVAPQSVEADLFERTIGAAEVGGWRARHGLTEGPIVLYVGRLVPEKGVGTLLETWRARRPAATLVLIGDGPLSARAARTSGARWLGPLPRDELPLAYAAATTAVLASIATPRFLEPWGLVCNEAMHQGRPMIASRAVGAVAGGLVRHERNGLVVEPGDPQSLGDAVDRLLGDDALRARLGAAAHGDVAGHTYDAMVAAFERALAS